MDKKQTTKQTAHHPPELTRPQVIATIATFKSNPEHYLQLIPDNTLVQLLRLHYIRNYSWLKVSLTLDYSVQNIYKLRKVALTTLADIIEKEG